MLKAYSASGDNAGAQDFGRRAHSDSDRPPQHGQGPGVVARARRRGGQDQDAGPDRLFWSHFANGPFAFGTSWLSRPLDEFALGILHKTARAGAASPGEQAEHGQSDHDCRFCPSPSARAAFPGTPRRPEGGCSDHVARTLRLRPPAVTHETCLSSMDFCAGALCRGPLLVATTVFGAFGSSFLSSRSSLKQPAFEFTHCERNDTCASPSAP